MYIIRDKGRDDEPQYDLTEEQEAELEEAIAELERGEYVDWDDVREAFLRRHQ
jgi:predicted transcriptional regulator